jgi:hypothetical protein
MRLSKHFIEKWLDRMGYKPDIESIMELVKNGICIQKGRVCEKTAVPSIFWNYRVNIIIVVNDKDRKIITFYVA